MSDIKLFRLANSQAAELPGTASDLEKPLQTLLGIRFVASEYSLSPDAGYRSVGSG